MTTEALDYSRDELCRHGLRLEAQVVECLRELAAGDRDGILASLRLLKLETAATRKLVRAAFAGALSGAAVLAQIEPSPATAKAAEAQGLAPVPDGLELAAVGDVGQALVVETPPRTAHETPAAAPTRVSRPKVEHTHRLVKRQPLTVPELPSNGAVAVTARAKVAAPPVGQPRPVESPADPNWKPVHAEVLRLVAAHPGRLTPEQLEEHQEVGLRYAAGYLVAVAGELVAAGRLELVEGRLLPVG